ncbi:hypothetical protein ACP275_08G252900 [Erythranthe tilingii]
MKPISPRPIFKLSLFTTVNHKIINNSQILAFSTQPQQNPGTGYHRGRHDEDSRAVRVSVWWDFENCNLPLNTNAFRVSQCITNAVRANGMKGPVQITAFGDVMQISRTNQEALSSTGINFSHVPSGGKNSADRSLLVDLMYWVSQNPPPAHLFLISGDRDFAGVLHRLRMNNYNILLASPDSAPSVLCSAATIMWQWSSLLKGENLSGKLFNQPPDGPYNSWYGHHKAPLEDPFAIIEQSSCGPAAEESAELAADSKIRPIPKAVMKHIRQILNPHPDGISIVHLRAELNKADLVIDKDFYGYKKFSRFLLAMPSVLKLRSVSDGQFFVQGVGSKILDESVPAEVAKTNDVTEKSTVPPLQEPKRIPQEVKQNKIKMESCAKNIQDSEKGDQGKEPSPKRNKEEIREVNKGKLKSEEQEQKVEAASPLVETKDSVEKKENQIVVPNDRDSSSDIGIFRKIWMKWFRSGDANNTDKNCVNQDKTLSGNEKMEKMAKTEKSPVLCESSEYVFPALFSPSSHEALIDGNIARFKSWNSRAVDYKVRKNGEIEDRVKVNGKQVDIFSEESFWNEMESFVDSPQGSACFSQSRNRVHLMQKFKNEGPPFLRSLYESDLLRLVDLLISNKKWLKECNFQTLPFKLTRPTGKDPKNIPSPNGLSQIFSDKQPNVVEIGERKLQNPPHKDSSSKTKSELLADCQNLVDYIVKEYPEGFNMGAFRKLFLEKKGYALDLQKLGYEKLVNLLQIMPRMKIESNLILPAGEFKIPDLKSDDSDSSWDELGPVNKVGPTKAKLDSKAVDKKGKKTGIGYEPLKEDEFFSDSDEEKTENGAKSKSEEESSLLQILDSWHGGKEEKSKSTTKVAEGTTPSVSPAVKPARKTNKPVKSYSFVTEQQGDGSKDALVDGILGSLKKTSEKSLDSRVLG